MKWIRSLAAAFALAGLWMLAAPLTADAGTCKADSGASCTCTGRCWADALLCGCGSPPP
jgi:hypothetical protein